MNKSELTKIIIWMSSTWPRQEMGDETILSYMDGIADLPNDLTLKALKNLRATEDWLPTVARVRRKVYGLANFSPPTLDVAMMQAEQWLKWQQVHRLVVNESGITPHEPQIHPMVVSTLNGVSAKDGTNWSEGFRFVYKENIESWKNMILSMNFNDVKEMINNEQ